MVLREHTLADSDEHPPLRRPRIFTGRIVHSKSLLHLEILLKATLGIRPDGSIAFLQHSDRGIEDVKATEPGFQHAPVTHLGPSQLLMPGLVDTHFHAPQWPNLALGMEGQLKEWVENWTNPVEVPSSSRRTLRPALIAIRRHSATKQKPVEFMQMSLGPPSNSARRPWRTTHPSILRQPRS